MLRSALPRSKLRVFAYCRRPSFRKASRRRRPASLVASIIHLPGCRWPRLTEGGSQSARYYEPLGKREPVGGATGSAEQRTGIGRWMELSADFTSGDSEAKPKCTGLQCAVNVRSRKNIDKLVTNCFSVQTSSPSSRITRCSASSNCRLAWAVTTLRKRCNAWSSTLRLAQLPL